MKEYHKSNAVSSVSKRTRVGIRGGTSEMAKRSEEEAVGEKEERLYTFHRDATGGIAADALEESIAFKLRGALNEARSNVWSRGENKKFISAAVIGGMCLRVSVLDALSMDGEIPVFVPMQRSAGGDDPGGFWVHLERLLPFRIRVTASFPRETRGKNAKENFLAMAPELESVRFGPKRRARLVLEDDHTQPSPAQPTPPSFSQPISEI